METTLTRPRGLGALRAPAWWLRLLRPASPDVPRRLDHGLTLVTVAAILVVGGATIAARPGIYTQWTTSLPWMSASLGVSSAAVLLASRRPELATVLALTPFGWLLLHRQWLMWWEVAGLAIVALTAMRSPRLAVVPTLGVLGSLLLVVPQNTVMLVGPTTPVHLWRLDVSNQDGGWPLDTTEFLVQHLLTLASVFLLSAALGVLARSDVSRQLLSTRAAALSDAGAVQAERARLAADLHDVVAHHVSLIAVRAETAPYQDPSIEPASQRVLGEIAEDARRALAELRGVLGVLQRSEGSPELAPQPTLRDLPELVLRSIRAGDRIHADGVDAPWIVPDTVGYVVYRVVQEALTNARRHAPGAAVQLGLDRDGDELVVTVVNGAGRTAPAGHPDPGQGLVSMAERVEALGGVLVAGPTAEGGFHVTARVPMHASP